MNLTDVEILELNDLCNAVIEGTLTEKQKVRLVQRLADSEPSRRFYVRAMGLSASLMSYASEMQTEKVDVWVPRERPAAPWWRHWWGFVPFAAAACAAVLFWLNWSQESAVASAPKIEENVAQLTGSKDCVWADHALAVPQGSLLQKNQRLELAKGFAEVTFDCGAKVVLEGPASLDLKSAWMAALNQGKLRATVPPQAVGFSVVNPSVQIVDLGTEFTMSADGNGAADVLVLKGEVEAQPNTTVSRQSILLAATESRCFAASGVSPAINVDQTFAQLTHPLGLDHFDPPTDIVHWSFDETEGSIFKADAMGLPAPASNMKLKEVSPGGSARAHSVGNWQGSLKFDGHLYAKASVPGLSGLSQHTVAFWIKVPKDAKLCNAYSMVAWGLSSEKQGSHPIHIGWNRNPNEGTIGVLRTDYGGGYAMGSTPLRDGQWHHIAVILTPIEDTAKTMEVKQYVDGRLEGEGQASPPGSELFKQFNNEKSQSLKDIVWLGCRLGPNGVRYERFCGEMDELYIADRALEPQEIVQLMNFNQLQPEVAQLSD